MSSTDAAGRQPSRHDRVWLDPDRWRSSLRSTLDHRDRAAVDAWVRLGRAVVARRREPGTGDDERCLAIALPLDEHRRRIGFVVHRRAVVRVAPPLSLDDVIETAPSTHRPALEALRRSARSLATPLSVYGSFAWQVISGSPCITPASDLDLLWTSDDVVAIDRVVSMLLAWETGSGLRADGEVRSSGGDAVAWRELAKPVDRVLVKRDDGVALRPWPLPTTG